MLSLVGPENGHLNFTNPSAVLDPSNSSKQYVAPDGAHEWLSWLQRHPTLQTSEPVPVSVGGASGMQMDVMLGSSTLDSYPRDLCGKQPCVPLYPMRDESGIVSGEGWKDRFVIVEVANQTVLIDIAAPAAKFDEFLPKARKLLKSIERA